MTLSSRIEGLAAATKGPIGYDASISPCGLYRYSLSRVWGPPGRGIVAWIMLNPSTADASKDDPTIRRCMSFAHAWGYDGIEVVNLYALRSPNPADLRDSAEAGIDPIGPENDKMIEFVCRRAALRVAAWGSHGFAQSRALDVLGLPGMDSLSCLGVTAGGAPRHPLYLRRDAALHAYESAHQRDARGAAG